MSDYFPGEITIGGHIPRRLLAQLAGEIENAGVCQEYGGSAMGAARARELLNKAAAEVSTAYFCNDQARWGRFEELEEWLTSHGIDFDRHSDARYEWDAENAHGRGRRQPLTASSNTDGKDLADCEEIRGILAGRSVPARKLATIARLVRGVPALAPLRIMRHVSGRRHTRRKEKQ